MASSSSSLVMRTKASKTSPFAGWLARRAPHAFSSPRVTGLMTGSGRGGPGGARVAVVVGVGEGDGGR
eukprot:16428260-Heterocapsa_arctica.AAC.1